MVPNIKRVMQAKDIYKQVPKENLRFHWCIFVIDRLVGLVVSMSDY